MSATVLAHPSAPEVVPVPVLDEADCPNDLESPDERKVWLELAPLAMANGTLTPATGLAFAELVRTVLIVRGLEKAPMQQGTANHSTWKKLLDAQLLNFSLRPCGKPMVSSSGAAAPKPASPLDRFIKRRGA